MQLSLDKGDATYQIQAYRDGYVLVNGQKYFESIVIMPEHLITSWGPTSLELLTQEDFNVLLAIQPELVLLGTGKQLQFPAKNLYAILTKHKIGVEVMDTAAACRTYTLLATEGRKVAAALLLI